jgi:hypothetical protein
MNEILTTIRQRFAKGLREAPYVFFVPIIVVGRGIRLGLRIMAQQLDTAMADARAKASRSSERHK